MLILTKRARIMFCSTGGKKKTVVLCSIGCVEGRLTGKFPRIESCSLPPAGHTNDMLKRDVTPIQLLSMCVYLCQPNNQWDTIMRQELV